MGNNKSRTVNYSRNAFYAALYEVFSAVLSFVVRIVFVRCLAKEYLGLSGLFGNILTILSLAELGVGTSIVYSMYKPLAINDTEKVKSLVTLYRKLYGCIGVAVFVLGVCLVPFLGFFVKELPDIPHSEFLLIYFLTVFNTAIGYFFSYKFSIFTASQQSSVVKKTNILFAVGRSCVEIVILLVLRNYIAYLIVAAVTTITCDLMLYIKADRQYPYLKEKAAPLDRESVVGIRKNVFAMLLYKLGTVVATTIDTLLISKYFGLVTVAIYTNYHLIISYSDKFFSSVLGTITPSLGNLMVEADEEKKLRVFSTLQMVYYWIATYLAVGLIVLFNLFIEIVFGADFLFDQTMVIALVVSITLTNFQRPCSLTRDATGLFWYGKLRPLAMAIINLVSSIVAVHYFGVIGVVIGTAFSKLTTYVWYDPYIVFKHTLKDGNLKRYYVEYILHWGLLACLAFICYGIDIMIPLNGIQGFLVGGIIVTVVVNGVYFLIYRKSSNMKYLMEIAKPFLSKLTRKHR